MQPRVKRILLFLAVLAMAFVFYGVFGRNTLLLTLENETVALSGPEGSSFSVPYSAIASMELREAFEPGTAVDGGVKNHIRYGLWQNEEFGEYRLFASDKIGPVIVLRNAEGETLVYNYESDKTTRSHYESFLDFLRQQGYEIQS